MSKIIHHSERKVPPERAHGDHETIDMVSEHILKYVGPIETVFHEVKSDMVHIDVHYVKPSQRRNLHTLITTGMSDKPMSPPESDTNLKYAELLITLPSNWPISMDAFRDEVNWWPIRQLKQLARFPHEYETWLWWCHTVPNGNPPQPYAPSTEFCCMLLAPPITLRTEFSTLRINDEKTIHFFSLIPLYADEMKFKMTEGADALFDLFDEQELDEIIKVGRKSLLDRKNLVH